MSRTEHPNLSRVFRRDFGKFKPTKLVPGVVGRSAWFVERAGSHVDALSLDRLKRANMMAGSLRDENAIRREVADDAEALLSYIAEWGDEQEIDKPTLMNRRGRARSLTEQRARDTGGLCALSCPLRTRTGGLLFIPVNEEAASSLDLEALVVAEVSRGGEQQLNTTFTYLAQHQVVAGRIPGPGLYQAFALPKEPWTRLALETLSAHWKWVERDPALKKMLSVREGSRPSPDIIDRICQIILAVPEYDRVEDPTFFKGIGSPPRNIDSEGSPERRRLGDCLGELEVVDGILQMPPLVKWWWHLRSKCTRWASIGPVPDSTFGGIGRVTQIDIHPSNGDILIAGAAGGGVWRTDNAGASWRPLMELEPTLTIGAVAIAPSSPSIMYAASGEDGGGWSPAWSGVGIYRSNNGGGNWTLMSSVASTRFSAIVVHPQDPNVIYVAGNTGLHKSVNGGVTWHMNPGLNSLFDGQVTDVVIGYDDQVIPSPMNVERVYIGVRNDGVYRSTTAGEQTTGDPAFTRLDDLNQLPSGSQAGWIKLSIGQEGAHRTYFLAAKLGPHGSRIFTTIDGGDTWSERAQDVAAVNIDEWCSVIAVDPTNEDVIYAGAASVLSRTTTGGANLADWTSINIGIHADQQDIAFDPRDPTRIYLGNDGGVYRSTNQGADWTFASGRLAITQLYDIDVSEHDRDICAGGAQDNGVYYRDATGAWHHIPWGDGTQVAIDPTDPQIFYFSSQHGLPENIRRSLDGGASHEQVGQTGLSGTSPWITIIKLEPRDPISNPADNRVLFVCGANELFRSVNGGQTWQRVEDGLGNPFRIGSLELITALEFAPSDLSILYMATSSGGVYRAVNGGANANDWVRIDTPGSPADALFPTARIQAIRVNPFDANDVWVVFGGSGVSFTSRPYMILNPLGISHLFRNPDATNINGWKDVSGQFAGLSLPDVPTSAVAISDFDRNVAYAGTDVGVFRTTDGGVSWTGFQEGLPRSPVVELKFNRRFNRLFAGTMGRGLYVRDV